MGSVWPREKRGEIVEENKDDEPIVDSGDSPDADQGVPEADEANNGDDLEVAEEKDDSAPEALEGPPDEVDENKDGDDAPEAADEDKGDDAEAVEEHDAADAVEDNDDDVADDE